MSFTKIHLALLIVSISILFAPSTHVVALLVPTPQTRTWNMCKPTTNPALCYKTILPKALVTPKFNMFKALEVEVQATQIAVVKTVANIATLLWKSATDKNIADALTVCKEQFGNIADAVTESVTLVSKNRNVVEARFKFSAVISYYQACKESLEESEITLPIVGDVNLVRDHGSNCLDLMKAIEDKEGKSKSGL